MAEPGHTAADAVVAVLLEHGVTTVFILPGEENLPLLDAVRRTDLEVVVCRHEQHAAFMAVAHARLTHRPGVVVATLGPGALNTFTGLAQAELVGVPVVAITGQKPRLDNEEGSFQVLDIVGSARPLLTAAVSLDDPALAGVTTRDLLRRAAEPGGAVLLELPEDVADAPVSARPRRLAGHDQPGPTVADPRLEAVARRIDAARFPVVLAGRRSTERAVSAALRNLAAEHSLPVLTTQMGKGAVDEWSAPSVRSLGMHRPDYAHLVFDEADLVVAVGYRPNEHPPRRWNRRDLPIVHLDERPAEMEAGYEPVAEAVGPLAAMLDGLDDLLGTTRPLAPLTRIRRTIDTCLAEEGSWSQPEPGEPLDPVSIVRAVESVTGRGQAVVALDNGAYKLWFARHFRASRPHGLLLDNATATMGAGLATAMEAARLGHRALAVVGDGGFLMNLGDLETASRLGLDLTILILTDEAYGFIAWHQEEQDRERFAVDLSDPGGDELARAFGARHHRVDSRATLTSVLAESLVGSGIDLVTCPIDYALNERLDGDALLERARTSSRSDGRRAG